MKILIEHPYYNPYTFDSPKGGTERFAHQAFQALKTAGAEVSIFVPSGGFVGDGIIESGILACSDGDVPQRLVKWYSNLNLVATEFDAVILNSSPSSVSFTRLPELASKSLSIAHYYHLCRSSQPSFRYSLLCKFIRKRGGRVVSVGQSFIDDSQKLWDSKHEYIKECYPKVWNLLGDDLPQFDGVLDINVCPTYKTPVKISKKVVAIGRPVKEKSLLLAAEAMALLPEYERIVYTYDDGGTYFQKLRQACETNGISLVLSAKHHQIMSGLSDAQCLLFPSHSETNGIVAFEAASLGVPVIYHCQEPAVFLKPLGLSRKINDDKSLVKSMVSAVLSEKQTPEDRRKISLEIQSSYTEKSLGDRLLSEIAKLPKVSV